MSLKDTLVQLAVRLTGAQISRVMPRGSSLVHDIKNNLPALRVEVIFDVGANTGQSARQYRQSYPSASLYCFEPVARTFAELQKNVGADQRAHLFQRAVGATEGTTTMRLQGSSDMFVSADAASAVPIGPDDVPTEQVARVTVDGFCASMGITHIDYMKIDTEGADLAVLEGADAMLRARQIRLVEVEAGMNPGNRHHVPLEVLKAHLESRGYMAFGIYEQTTEWPTRQPHLRRVNVAFVAPDLLASAPSA